VKRRQEAGVVVGDERGVVAEAEHLVHEHVGALAIDVVGDNVASGSAGERVHGVDDLRRLGAGRGAHVEHGVVGAQIEKHGRHHADRLLTCNETGVLHVDEKLMQLLQAGHFAQLHARHSRVPGSVAGPGLRLRQQVTHIVNFGISGLVVVAKGSVQRTQHLAAPRARRAERET
jgi:hypothetical protein